MSDEEKEKLEKEAKEKEEREQKALDLAANKVADALLSVLKKDEKEETEVKDKEYIRTKIFCGGVSKEIEFPSDLKTLTKEEKIVNFFKALPYADKNAEANAVMKALVEGTTTEGGYLVPEELRAEVWRILPDYSVMRKIARVIPMSTMTLDLNSLTARPVAYWTSEYASKTTSSAEFSQVTLTAHDLVCLLPISEQLLADANIGTIAFITQLFAEAIGAGEDKAFFTGSGTGQPKGISQETLTTVDAGGSASFPELLNLIYSLPQAVRRNKSCAFIMHKSAIQIARNLVDSQNRPLWLAGSPDNAGEPDRLYGYPVYEQNDIAATTIYFGDWSYYIIGDRQQMTVATTTEGGDAWRRNSIEVKAVSRVDGAAVLTAPFAKLTNWK